MWIVTILPIKILDCWGKRLLTVYRLYLTIEDVQKKFLFFAHDSNYAKLPLVGGAYFDPYIPSH